MWRHVSGTICTIDSLYKSSSNKYCPGNKERGKSEDKKNIEIGKCPQIENTQTNADHNDGNDKLWIQMMLVRDVRDMQLFCLWLSDAVFGHSTM